LFARDEHVLVTEAKRLATFRLFLRAVGYWASLADDEVGVEPTERQIRKRFLTLRRDADGNLVIRGVADPLAGAVIEEELNRIAHQLGRDDWDSQRDCPDGNGDPARTSDQRRLDALVEMARRSAGAGDDVTSPRPLFTIVVDYPTFTARVCELFNGMPVPPGAVARWLTEADIERIVFDGSSRVIDVGRRRRFFTGALRRAIEVRDRHCTHPDGCDVPAEHCDADHIVPYADGGETIQKNGRLRCPPHNRHADTGRSPPDDKAA
jgi:hypothetical protein